ncbi:hypothetical protein MATL_G00151130 [Megalops atlanticus]|uniref:E2 NEDD8-conjugating enzyme n=1 Tax=Megalops atlanticus TaxID=7932 RepID=A0A9D3PS73_MEGAT|nr:hypothetical protein MATL_G00151130 [Megalops atlanticus]
MRQHWLLIKVAELEASLPSTCKVIFPDENKLLSFQLDVSPDEGYYQSGTFQFEINVPEAYNMVPPKAKCLTQIWHPNITEAGGICLSILREHSTDGTGWAQTRTLKIFAYRNQEDPDAGGESESLFRHTDVIMHCLALVFSRYQSAAPTTLQGDGAITRVQASC